MYMYMIYLRYMYIYCAYFNFLQVWLLMLAIPLDVKVWAPMPEAESTEIKQE